MSQVTATYSNFPVVISGNPISQLTYNPLPNNTDLFGYSHLQGLTWSSVNMEIQDLINILSPTPLIYSMLAANTITATTFSTSIFGLTGSGMTAVNANTLKVGDQVRFEAGGFFSATISASGVFQMQTYVGGQQSSLFTWLPTGVPFTASNVAWKFETTWVCAATGSSGTIFAGNSWFTSFNSTTGNQGVAYLIHATGDGGSLTVNTTNAVTFDCIYTQDQFFNSLTTNYIAIYKI